MNFLVPSGKGKNILFWFYNGKEEYNSNMMKGFDEECFWVYNKLLSPLAAC